MSSPTEMYGGMVELDGSGCFLAGTDRQTDVPRVFGAGDVVSKDYRYLTTAMADGTVAALAAEK